MNDNEAIRIFTPLSAMEANELKQSDPKIKIVDVREDYEYEFCRIEGALIAPLSRFPESLQALNLSPDQPIILYCHHGRRSAKAAEYLHSQGYNHLYNLEGGIQAWSEEVDSGIPQY